MSSGSDVMACGREQSERCRDERQKLGQLVSNMMEDLLDEKAVFRILNNANAHVAMVDTPDGSLWKAYGQEIKLYNTFEGKRDIVGAVSASTHLPFISNGDAVATYRGKPVVDAGCTGQMFVLTAARNFVNVNIFPPANDGNMLRRENALGQFIVNKYATAMNKAEATIHAHPHKAKLFGLSVFGRDDLMVRPLEKDEALRRHHLGHQACLSWLEEQNNSDT